MAITRPELKTIINRTIGDVSARSAGSAYIRRSAERVIATAVAGAAHGLYGHQEWVAKQISPATCGIQMLLAWGSFLKLPRKGTATASGQATWSGTNGTELPADTTLQDDEGNTFTVTVGGTVADGEVTVTVEADVGGSAGNLDAGAPLSLVSPIAGLDTEGSVDETDDGDGLTGGQDIEDVEDYRSRIIDEARLPASGGGPGDYVKWAREVAGVTRAWEFGRRMGGGTVSVAFVMDERDDIIPTEDDVEEVQTYIDGVRPLDMLAAYVVAPVAKPVDLTIRLDPNTADVREQVTAELQELFSATDLEESLAQSEVDEAISTAQGEERHEITAITSLEPDADSWELLTLGDVTFEDWE